MVTFLTFLFQPNTFINYLEILQNAPDPAWFQFSGLPSLLNKINRRINKNAKSNFCCPYTQWSRVKLAPASPLEKTGSHFPPSTHACAIACEELHTFQHLYHTWGWISLIASCLVYFLLGGGGCGGCLRSLQCPSFLILSLWSSIALQKLPVATNSSMDHRLACGFWWWLGSWTSTWFPTVPAYFLQIYTCACMYIYEVVANTFRYRRCEFQVISLEKCKSVSLSVHMFKPVIF